MCWVYDGEQKSVPILAGGGGEVLINRIYADG